mmetsp:Transcript_20208/g.63405  ORF Transcript_20208/g.63405 Transcript_20208/m.63405 type:complete len:230 (+) Transcript_20208:194-883(+)
MRWFSPCCSRRTATTSRSCWRGWRRLKRANRWSRCRSPSSVGSPCSGWRRRSAGPCGSGCSRSTPWFRCLPRRQRCGCCLPPLCAARRTSSPTSALPSASPLAPWLHKTPPRAPHATAPHWPTSFPRWMVARRLPPALRLPTTTVACPPTRWPLWKTSSWRCSSCCSSRCRCPTRPSSACHRYQPACCSWSHTRRARWPPVATGPPSHGTTCATSGRTCSTGSALCWAG